MKKHKKDHPETVLEMDISSIDVEVGPKAPRSHHVVISLDRVSKIYKTESSITHALKPQTIRMYSGEFIIIYGPSGCGKSTLLHVILGLEEPTTGIVKIRGKSLNAMTPSDITRYRKEKIGMIFQQSHWIKSLTVAENVAYPLYLSGVSESEAYLKAYEALTAVDMQEYVKAKPMDLSGGQQQRVSLARALSTDPWIIMADEPTGNLDTASGYEVAKMLTKLNRVMRRTIIMVTHDINFLPLATRRIAMKDGEVIDDTHD